MVEPTAAPPEAYTACDVNEVPSRAGIVGIVTLKRKRPFCETPLASCTAGTGRSQVPRSPSGR